AALPEAPAGLPTAPEPLDLPADPFVPEPAAGPAPEPVGDSADEPAPAPVAGGAGGAGAGVAESAHLVFRVGRELFAIPLDAIEEAVDVDRVQRVPEMSAAMLGVLSLRGELVPLYASAGVLGAAADASRAALVFTTERGRIALAVDDVDDVLPLPPEARGRAPLDFGDALLVGVARRGADLIGVLDPAALIAACRADRALETA
ncbi:MAG: chemotaxis protein CheW, partial [Gemmatimonadota bacterium]|nr:chemotaxis protein CheW [Gemmatimonadota bacterium]